MALIAEAVVQEWLHRDGYFTIRGIRQGIYEVDILAIKYDSATSQWKCKHVEVQVSKTPLSYFTKKNAKQLSGDDLKKSVESWFLKKYNRPQFLQLRSQMTGSQECQRLFVHGKIKYSQELLYLQEMGVEVKPFNVVLSELNKPSTYVTGAATDIVQLISSYIQSENANEAK